MTATIAGGTGRRVVSACGHFLASSFMGDTCGACGHRRRDHAEFREVQYMCWCPDDEEEADATEVILVYDAEMAAREYAKDRYSRCDYPEEQNIFVRADGKLHHFHVSAEPDVRFRAKDMTP